MGRLIRKFEDGSELEYDEGKFDRWCVYLTRPDIPKFAPEDRQYFERLRQFAEKHGEEGVYRDFCGIYNLTNHDIEQTVLETISELAEKYGEERLSAEIVFTTLYAAMISEQNKKGTKLGKRIKRLGVHQILFDGFTVEAASKYSYNMGWRKIAAECEERGF